MIDCQSNGAGLPRSLKSHGISGILQFSGISGKVMEIRLKLMKVMETTKNPQKYYSCLQIAVATWQKIQSTGSVLFLYGHRILLYGHGKAMEFCHGNFVATLVEELNT